MWYKLALRKVLMYHASLTFEFSQSDDKSTMPTLFSETWNIPNLVSWSTSYESSDIASLSFLR